MKTNEFIKSVEALGFQTYVSGKKIKVCDEMRGYGFSDPMFILTSDLVDVHMPADFYISSIERLGVLKLVVEYLDTPNSEREEEKKYRVKFPSITRWGNAVYLQKDASDKDPIGVDWSPEDFIFYGKPTDYIFTEQEIKDIDERYLAFKVEVKDE